MKKKLLLVVIALLFVGVLTGCKKDKPKDDVVTPTEDQTQKQAEEAIEKDQKRKLETNYNNYEDFNVSQDDNKIEFQEGNSKIIYYYQGDKITGYESYITFDSKEVAEVAVKAFNDGSNPNIEKAYVDDKSVVIVYNEKAYQSKSLEDIKNEYEHVIKVKNGDYKYKN